MEMVEILILCLTFPKFQNQVDCDGPRIRRSIITSVAASATHVANDLTQINVFVSEKGHCELGSKPRPLKLLVMLLSNFHSPNRLRYNIQQTLNIINQVYRMGIKNSGISCGKNLILLGNFSTFEFEIFSKFL